MRLETFLDNFELLADAPNGVQKLRELILQLAVRGKLVPQDPNDEPASVLLEKIKWDRERLIKENKIKKNKPLPSVEFEELSFELPDGWQSVKLGYIYEFAYGKSLPDKARNEKGQVPVYGSNGIVGYHDKSLVTQPSLIVGRKGSSGSVNLANKPFWSIDTTYYVTPPEGINLLFSYYLIIGLDLRRFDKSTAIPGLNRQDAYSLLVGLPPKEEQKRIVAKVNQLMALCDELEARKQKRREDCLRLNNTAIDQLLTTRQPDEFSKHWQRICDNFDLLYSAPENIGKLRQAILQLAVQGKLVPQNPNDEPASVLLEKIKANKEWLVKEGKIKKLEPQPLIALYKVPYGLPPIWEWIRLDQIISLMDAGWSPACKNHPTEDQSTWGVLKTTAVQSLEYRQEEHKELPEHLKPRLEYEVRVGDLLITRAGPKNRVGVCCLVKETRPRLMISDKLIRFHLIEQHILPDFLVLSLNTGFSQKFIESQKSGMAESQMNISQTKLRMTPIPFPPINEQKRIVAKVDQLMTICNELEAKLTQSQTDSEKLMDAAVRQVLIA